MKREAGQGSGSGDKATGKLADEYATAPPPGEVLLAPLGSHECAKEG